MREKLKTLKGLAEEEVSEAGLLKCRIEQQAELIYILKQRADEYLKKYMEIENKSGKFEIGSVLNEILIVISLQ